MNFVITWWQPQTSGYSYLRVTAIQIDVHPTGKTQQTWHVHFPRQSKYARRTLSTSDPRTWQPFTSHRQDWANITAPEKKCSRLHLSARLSGPWDPPQFLSQDSHWSSRLKTSTCGWLTTGLTGPISLACDRYIQYLLTGSNPSVLKRHRRGLPHRKPWNSHITLPAIPFRGFH
jgi:hypothetical protein